MILNAKVDNYKTLTGISGFFYTEIICNFGSVKKLTAILLCCIFLFNIMGYYAVFLVQRIQLKKEMQAFIKCDAVAESLQKLVIPVLQYDASVDFIEENEFFYQNELYDLVKKETSSKFIMLYCINDQKEELLLEAAQDHFSRNNDQSTSSKEKSSQIIKNIIKEVFPVHQLDIDISNFHMHIFSSLTFILSKIYVPLISPPPKSHIN